MSKEQKTIALSPRTYDKLMNLGNLGTTVDEVVSKLIDKCGDEIK